VVKHKPRKRSEALHTPRLRRVLARIWKRGLLELKLIPLTFDDYAESRPPGLDKYSEASSKFGADILGGIPPCDVINLHWVADFVDCSLLPLLGEKPLVWTLHDMNPFT